MKQIYLNIQDTTSTFNLVGKIATYTILIFIAISVIALFIGALTTDNLTFRY